MNNPYRSPADLHETQPATASLGLVVFGIVLSALPAAASWLVVEQFREALTAFGADLPALTRLLFEHHNLLWLVPVLVAAIAFRSPAKVRTRRALALGGATMFTLVPVCVIALYLPIFKLGAVVG